MRGIFASEEDKSRSDDSGLLVDQTTGVLVTMDWKMHQVHNGRLWSVSYIHDNIPDGGVAQSLTHTYGNYLHVYRARWWSTGNARVCLHPLPEVEDYGTEIYASNFSIGFMGAGIRTNARFWVNPKIINPGVVGFQGEMPGGFSRKIGPFRYDNRVGGFHKTDAEWVIAPNIGPILGCIRNLSGAPATVSWQFILYEANGDYE